MKIDVCAAHGCAACCYETEMPLTDEDIARLVALGHDRDEFVTYSDDETAQLKVREEPGKPCFFLRENRCNVYADRPAGCRIYPLVLNERERVVRDEDCPHRAEFPILPDAKRRILRVVNHLARRP